MQDVSSLTIAEGEVRTIHDKDNRLLWGKVNYDTGYKGDTTQQTYSGKNLLPSNGLTVLETNGITFTPVYNENNELLYINANGTYTGSNSSIYYPIGRISFISGVTYTCSGCDTGSNATYRIWVESASSGAFPAGNRLFSIDGPHTATASANENNVRVSIQVYKDKPLDNVKFYPQIEQSSSSNPYEPYTNGASPNPDYPQAVNVVTGTQTITISDGTNSQNYTVGLGAIELCKIGTYQDYIYKSGNDWYVHREVGKYTFNGSEGWATLPYGTNSWQLGNIISIYNYNMYDIYLACDFSQGAPYSARSSGDSTKTCICYTDTANKLFVRNTTLTTQAQMQTATTGKNIYYVTTPIDTQITDSTLMGQLNAIHEWLTRYGYNATVSGNLPIIIDRTNL